MVTWAGLSPSVPLKWEVIEITPSLGKANPGTRRGLAAGDPSWGRGAPKAAVGECAGPSRLLRAPPTPPYKPTPARVWA